MSSVIIIPPVPKSEPERCPHCKEVLPEPEIKAGSLAIAVLILGYCLGATVTFGSSAALAKYDKCEPLGTRRWHYIFPTPVLGCIAGRWLNNEDKIFKED